MYMYAIMKGRATDDLAAETIKILVRCIQCTEMMVHGDLTCLDCGYRYSDSYWHSYSEDLYDNDSYIDVESRELEDSAIKDLDFDTTLCCNKPSEECMCTQTISWSDTHLIPRDVDEMAYDKDSVCLNCEYFFMPKCIPYRNYAYDYLLGGTIGYEIEGCSNFKLKTYSGSGKL